MQKEPLAFALVCKYGSRHSCENICKYEKNSRRICSHVWFSQYLWKYFQILVCLSSLLIKYLQKWLLPDVQNISMLGKCACEKLLTHYKLPCFLIFFPLWPTLPWTSNSKVENEARTLPWNKMLKPTMGTLMRLKGCPSIFFKKLSFWSFDFMFFTRLIFWHWYDVSHKSRS